MRIALMADSHLGTTFDGEGFAKQLDRIMEQNPDMLLIAGDFVDDSTKREDIISAVHHCKKDVTQHIVFPV